MHDVRDDIFRSVMSRSVTAVILSEEAGIVAGTREAAKSAASLGLAAHRWVDEGESVRAGAEVARISGNPKQIALAEDLLIGLIAKPSGIAGATRKCVDKAGGRVRIVCGSWKKMPVVLKESIRAAIALGGGYSRISEEPFLYLDKNYVLMLGGIRPALEAVRHFSGHRKVIQINGRLDGVETQASEAADWGADILYIDNGRPRDIHTVSEVLDRKGARGRIEIAFGGNVRIEDIDRLKETPVDILGIGRQIIDAPLLDLRMEVVS
jgi:nicotinate-nucleotide pyrophosphorylase (carboxylating)